MDDFSEFITTNEQNGDNDEQDDLLFGTDFTVTNTVNSSSINLLDTVQQTDLSRAMNNENENDSPTTRQTDDFSDDDDDDDNFPIVSQTLSLHDNFQENQLRSYSPLSNDNEILNDDFAERSSENHFSSNTMAKLSSSTMKLSALETFNQRRRQEIAELDEIEQQKIEQLRQQGKQDLQRWYDERRRQMEQKRHTMKQEQDTKFNEALKKSNKQSCDWAKVIRFLEFAQGTQLTKHKRDLNRMRAIIIQAKRDKDNETSENGSD